MTALEYKKFRLKEWFKLIKYCFTLLILLGLIVWAPSQAGRLAGYLGAFILGGTKFKSLIGF